MAVFLLGEILTVQTILAIFIIFLGLTLLFLQKDFDWHGGIVLSLLASIFAAAGAIANTILVRGSLGVMTVSFTMVASQLPLLFVLFLFYKSNADGFGEILTLGVLKETIGYGRRRNLLKDVLKAKWKLLVGATIMESIAVAGVNWSYRGGPSSMATTVFMSFSVITTVIFGYVFLNERKYFLRKIISGTIIIAGILVLKFVSL
ncbi:hypothetical protein HY310_01910 [Candidatus Microgenomates bacterium]|nr:hypothetical protein [Candidatus Microgenomates bacterium]